MPRIWLPLAVVLLLGVGLFLFLQPPAETPETVDPVQPPQVEETIDAAPEIAPSIHRTQADNTTETVERTELVLPESGPQVQYAKAAAEGILISVVDGTTSAPLPLADVMVIDTGVTNMKLLEVEIQSRPDFERLFLKLGVTYRTDKNGQVVIPHPLDDLLIAGRTPTHFNFAFDVDTDEEEIFLRLNPVELLPVKVVDERGLPVKGAPVALRMANSGFTQDLIQAYTNAEGIANLKIFDLLKVELGDDEMFVALLALTDNPIQHPVNLKEMPEETPVLIMPQVGQVEVKVYDETGKLVTDSYVVDLAIVKDEEFQQDFEEPLNYWMDPHPHITGSTNQGVAMFPLVQPGTKLRATAVSRDQEQRAHVDDFGPSKIGERVSLSVAPAIDRPIVIGRILNEEGMAGANLTLKSRLKMMNGGSTSSHNASIHTDEEGRFRMVLEEKFEDGGTRELTVTMRKTKRKPKRSVMVDLSRHYDAGVHDLGDLVVIVPPLLAEGMVFDPQGQPLAKANVILEEAHYYGENKEHKWWNGHWDLREETAKDGTFEIRGHVKDAVYRVAARHDDYLQSEKEITLGATGVHLSLKQAVKLEGRFLFDEGIDPEQLKVTIWQASKDDPETEESNRTELGSTGKFSFEHRREGSARIALVSTRSNEELFSLDAIQLSSANGKVHDLGDIDLRGRLTAFNIRVVDSLGNLVSHPTVRQIDQTWGRSSEENPVQILTTGTALDIYVSANGYRPQELKNVSSETTVTLVDGIPIHLQLTNGSMLPEGFAVSGRMQLLTEDGEQSSFHGRNDGQTDSGRDLLIGTVHAPGSYKVQFTLDRSVRNGSQSWALPGGDQIIDILDRTSPQVFSVEIPKSILKHADERAEKTF